MIVMFAVLHGSALVLCACMFLLLARSASGPPSPEDKGREDGGEGPSPIRPGPSPCGGRLLLPNSEPAQVRLRGPIPTGGLWSRRTRRPCPEFNPRPTPEERPLRLGTNAR
jgi:hypothetical protein